MGNMAAGSISERYLKTDNIADVHLMENGNLAVRCKDGGSVGGLKPRRLFPLTRKGMYINLIDSKGDEVGLIKNPSVLDRCSAKNIMAALDRFYLIPRIKKIHKVEEAFGIVKWHVVTDRGEKVFEVLNSSTDIKQLGDGHYVIRDSDDNRYEVKNISAFDKVSISILEGQL